MANENRKALSDVPIHTAKGTTIGPVAVVCATLAFIAALAAYIIVVLYGQDDNVDKLVRPLIAPLATVAAGAALWFKTHQNQVLNTDQNVVIAKKADEAAVKAKDATEVVSKRLNGELDARIQEAVLIALNKAGTVVVPANEDTPKPVTKRIRRKLTPKKEVTDNG